MNNSTLKALVPCCSCAPYEMKSGPVTPSCPAAPRVRVDQRSAGLGWAGLGWAGLGCTKHNQKHINLELPPPRQQQRTPDFNPHISQLRHNSGPRRMVRKESIYLGHTEGRGKCYVYLPRIRGLKLFPVSNVSCEEC